MRKVGEGEKDEFLNLRGSTTNHRQINKHESGSGNHGNLAKFGKLQTKRISLYSKPHSCHTNNLRTATAAHLHQRTPGDDMDADMVNMGGRPATFRRNERIPRGACNFIFCVFRISLQVTVVPWGQGTRYYSAFGEVWRVVHLLRWLLYLGVVGTMVQVVTNITGPENVYVAVFSLGAALWFFQTTLNFNYQSVNSDRKTHCIGIMSMFGSCTSFNLRSTCFMEFWKVFMNVRM